MTKVAAKTLKNVQHLASEDVIIGELGDGNSRNLFRRSTSIKCLHRLVFLK